MTTLVQKINAFATRVGTILRDMQTQINGKLTKPAVDGTTGQFLAYNNTWQTPAGGGGGSVVALPVLPAQKSASSYYTNALNAIAPVSLAPLVTASGYPFLCGKGFTISELGIFISSLTTSGKKLQLAIYSASAVYKVPNTLLWSGAVTTLTASGYKGFTCNFTFQDNTVYYLAIYTETNQGVRSVPAAGVPTMHLKSSWNGAGASPAVGFAMTDNYDATNNVWAATAFTDAQIVMADGANFNSSNTSDLLTSTAVPQFLMKVA